MQIDEYEHIRVDSPGGIILYIIGEVLLLVNVLLNSLILFATGRIMSLPCQFYKIGRAAILGSLLVLLPSFPGEMIISLLSSVIILLLAFGLQKFRTLLRTLLVFYGISFIMGGGIIAIVYLMNGHFSNLVLRPGNLPIWYLLVAFVIALAAVLGMRYLERKAKITKLSVPVKLVVNGKTVELNALIDTGNQLQTFTGEYCLVVEARALNGILTSQDQEAISQMSGSQPLYSYELIEDSQKRFFPLWFHSLGTNHGILLAFRPDKLALGYSEIIEQSNVTRKRDPWQEVSALIAVTFQDLNIDDNNCGLVPAELLKFSGG